MAQDKGFDPARLEQIERRLQVLEDAEEIRNLKARYAALCDNQYDADGIAGLFTQDAVWESPALGRFEGRDAIRNFFRGASSIFSFAIQSPSIRSGVGEVAKPSTCRRSRAKRWGWLSRRFSVCPVGSEPTIFGMPGRFQRRRNAIACAIRRSRSC